MLRWTLGFMVAIVLAGCGTPSAEDLTATSVAATVQAATDCRVAAVAYGDEMTPIFKEWDDQQKLAGQTGRAQLASQIQELQAIKRKADAVKVPDCAKEAHGFLISGMDDTIDGFLGFMGQADKSTYENDFKNGQASFTKYEVALKRATTPPMPATTTP